MTNSKPGAPRTMTLVEHNQMTHLLDGLVKCRNCNAPLENTGEYFRDFFGLSMKQEPHYVCVSKTEGCIPPTKSAEFFNLFMFKEVLETLLGAGNDQRVVDWVRMEARKAMTDLDRNPQPQAGSTDVFKPLESRDDETPQQRSELPEPADEMERNIPRSVEEFPEAQERMAAAYNHIASHPSEIEEYSHDLKIYRRDSNIQITRAIVESTVEEILADRDSAIIRYRMPVPTGSGNQSRTSQEVIH